MKNNKNLIFTFLLAGTILGSTLVRAGVIEDCTRRAAGFATLFGKVLCLDKINKKMDTASAAATMARATIKQQHRPVTVQEKPRKTLSESLDAYFTQQSTMRLYLATLVMRGYNPPPAPAQTIIICQQN